MQRRLISAALLLALSGSGWGLSAEGDAMAKRDGTRVYIVALEGEPLAGWRGGVVQGKRLTATSPAVTGARSLDVTRPESKAYLDHLGAQHAEFLRAASAVLGRSVTPRFDYRVAVNGMAIELDAAEAERLRGVPSLVAIAPERIHRPMTDAGPAWIGAEAVWNGTVAGSNVRTRGEGAIVGVIDTGINASHPSFADIGADGYNHTNPRGRFYGACETAPARCTDKLIGIRDFTTEGARDGSDLEGHGTHVASTAVGNVIDSPITTMTGSIPLRVSGVAPRANLITYKACIQGEGDEEGSCPSSATLAAINQAIVDQVDVINYSLGSSPTDPWQGIRGALDDEGAFLNARFAGIVAVVAAGNDGPGAATVSSPSNAPWVISVANVSHDRKFGNAAINVTGTGITAPLRFEGQSLTGGTVTARVVDAASRGFPLCSQGDAIDFPPTGASNPFAPGTFNGEIVVCRRGVTGRVTKGFNLAAAGAGGMILYNTAAEGESTVPDDHHLPATHIGAAAGTQLVNLLAAGGPQGQFTATITATQAVRTGTGDLLSASSGRGPVAPAAGYLKPDIAAPGSGILAAARNGNGLATLSGTSMASPHVAGAAALLAAAQPTWSVAQIESALLTTTIDDVVLPDAVTRASAHDGGAGRANVADAARAGLWFDISREAFVAADPRSTSNAIGARDTSRLNRPSLATRSCLEACAFERVVTAFADGTWRASSPAVPGLRVTVSPESFTLARGQTQALSISVAITDPRRFGQWNFARVELTPSGAGASLAKTTLPIAVLSDPGALPDEIRVTADTTNGFRDVNIGGLAALRNPRFETGPLARLAGQSQGLPADPTRDDRFDLPSPGVFVKFLSPPAELFGGGYGVYVQSSSPTARDIDMVVGLDDNGDGQPQESEARCTSESPVASELCVVAFPTERTRRVWVLVQNFTASTAGATDIVTISDVIVPLKSSPSAAPKLAATAPGRTEDQRGFPVRFAWNEPRMLQGETWIGFAGLSFGASSVGHAPVVLSRANNLVAPIVMQAGASGRDSEALALAPGNAHDRIVIDVPPTATALTITTAGDGEVDLYVAKATTPVAGPDLGVAPARGQAQGTSIHPGATERVDLAGTALTPGRWYVTPVNAGSTDARFTLEVALTESGTAPVVTDNGYYNVSRAGHGVFFHQIGELWAIVWYTYLQDGSPAWYIATGPRPAAGKGSWSAPLLRFTWDGAVSASTVVGEAAITPTARDRFVYSWVLDGAWASEAFEPTGTIACAPVVGTSNNSVSGSWFAPTLSGYGFNIVTTASTEAMTTYVYDAAGNPRWLLGSSSTPGRGAVSLTQFLGFCPTCAFAPIQASNGGTLTRSYQNDGTANAALAIAFGPPATGTWTTSHAIQKITATLPCP